MMEVCIYGIEKTGWGFSFTHDMQRFLLHLHPLLAGQMFRCKLELLHYHVPHGDSL